MNKGQKYIVKENFNLIHLYTAPNKWQVRKGDEWEIKSVNHRKKVITLTKYEHDRLIMKLTFDMFEKLFEKGVQPTTITKVPEEVQDILYKNIYNLDNVLTCIQQQKKYGIPSTGDSPNVNLFLNRFAQLYNTKTPELAIKYADSNVNDKLQLESFVRDYKCK